MRNKLAVAAIAAVPLLGGGAAGGGVAAGWVEGQGGMEASGSAEGAGGGGGGAHGGIGFQLGARLLIFEGYVDHTAYGGDAAATRGILGLRGGFGSHDLR